MYIYSLYTLYTLNLPDYVVLLSPVFYAPISLGRKFYFNASESQITHNVGASPTERTATHLLAHTHQHTPFYTCSHSHTHSTVDRVRAHSERVLPAHCPLLLPPAFHSHSQVITHIFSGLKLNHFPFHSISKVISGRAQPKTTECDSLVNLKELPRLVILTWTGQRRGQHM